ncbi:MAG: recombinase family protein [Acidimicrobiales bacterium]
MGAHSSEHRFVVGDLMAGRAAIYTRLSKDRLEERSREDQEADCRALCAIKGFTVVTVHTDLESGYRRSARRPGYEALLEDLRAGAVDVVVIWKLDRLTRQGIRQIAPLLDVLEACAATLLSVHDPIDTSSAMGEGVLGMLRCAFAAPSATTPRQVVTRTVAPDPRDHRGPVRGGGRGSRPQGGGRTGSGRPIPAVDRHRLASPWHCDIEGRNVDGVGHRKILDETTCARLRAVLTDPARPAAGRAHRSGPTTGPPVHSYLLTGLLRCGRCGARMRSTKPKTASGPTSAPEARGLRRRLHPGRRDRAPGRRAGPVVNPDLYRVASRRPLAMRDHLGCQSRASSSSWD